MLFQIPKYTKNYSKSSKNIFFKNVGIEINNRKLYTK